MTRAAAKKAAVPKGAAAPLRSHDAMTRLERALRRSLAAARRAWREGYSAEDKGHSARACPYDRAALREAWLRGFRHSARDRRPTHD